MGDADAVTVFGSFLHRTVAELPPLIAHGPRSLTGTVEFSPSVTSRVRFSIYIFGIIMKTVNTRPGNSKTVFNIAALG